MESQNKQDFFKKLIAIQCRLNVPKLRENKFGDFKYRNAEDILDAVKPLLASHGLLLTLTDKVIFVGERYYVEATATITDGINSLQTSACAREPEQPKAKTDVCQQTGACSTYARKYALNGLFCIDDTKDPDSDNGNDKQQPNKQQPKRDSFKETHSPAVGSPIEAGMIESSESAFQDLKENSNLEYIAEGQVTNFVIRQQELGITDDEVRKMLKEQGFSHDGSRKHIVKAMFLQAKKALEKMKG
jgi:hypothetical protein